MRITGREKIPFVESGMGPRRNSLSKGLGYLSLFYKHGKDFTVKNSSLKRIFHHLTNKNNPIKLNKV